MRARLLRYLLILNAFGCVAAAVVLILFPFAIPSMIGISIEPGQYMISRLLGASELAIAAACLIAICRPSRESYDLCIVMLVVFHAGSIAAGAAALVDHVHVVVMVNIVVRAAIITALLTLARGRPTMR